MACSGTILAGVQELNPRQQEAVEHGEGPLLLLAAAGSGKTRVLAHRMARLIDQGCARPEEMLAVTFTNKAGRELVSRCAALIGGRADALWAGTFHGIGARIIRRHAAVLGYPPDFSIFDADDQKRLVKDVLEASGLDASLYTPEGLRAFIEAAKNDAKLPGDSSLARNDPFGRRYGELYGIYQERLRKLAAMDFGDLILGVLRVFDLAPEILGRYRERFRYVFVDEYQDTNHAQYLMVSTLAAGRGNICVVGDDDQSIYGWRGASLRNILEFERDFPGARTIRLDQSYRSTETIIGAARAVIANNRSRMEKSIWTRNPPGEPIKVFEAADERDEASYIVDRLRAMGPARGEAAVFYRTNAQSRAIEDALVHARIPYVIVGTTRFYERREIRDLIAYLRLVHNPNDDVSLSRVINVPTRGIGRTSWEALKAAAATRGSSVWASMPDAVAGLRGAAGARITAFRRLVDSWRAGDATKGVTPVLERILEDTEYAMFLSGAGGEDAAGRIENVRELLTVAQNFDATFRLTELAEEDRPPTPLSAFLEQLTLASEVDSYEARDNAVTLMTVHNAKGLEFREVFIAGFEEGLFPHARSTADSERGIEEERRLCYVAITRARERLYLLRALRRHVFGATQLNFPSRFLEEIPADLLDYERSKLRGQTVRDTLPAEEAVRVERQELTSPGAYAVGMKVVHPMFGVGTVKKCDTSGGDEKVVIQFQRGGVKKLVARFARLQIV